MSKTYTTMQGDMWDGIAYRLFGDCAIAPQIMALNPQYLEHYIFPQGIVLQLPDPDLTVSDPLPPWKQVAG